MAIEWQTTKVGDQVDLRWKKNKGVEIWCVRDFVSATQMTFTAIRDDNWTREVDSRRAGLLRKAGDKNVNRVMTLGAVERMLGEFHWDATKRSLLRPKDGWVELDVNLMLHKWVVERIQGSPTPSYAYVRGSQSCEVRYVLNVRGEPLWVAEDVFKALGIKWRGYKRVAYVPPQWQPTELLSYDNDVKHRTCLYWPGVKMVLAGANRPATWAFKDDLMARFGEVHSGMFQEFQ